MPIWINLYTQDSLSPVIEHLKFFHDHRIVVVISLRFIFFILIIFSTFNKKFNHFYLESQLIEFFWTFAPSIILIFLAIPSIKILYLLEEQIKPLIAVKITGYQWFWGYEYFNSNQKTSSNRFEANILKTNKTFKLLETSNNLILPYAVPVRLLVTSKDVIHSWAMPSICTKMDAIPGRINQATIIINRPGILVGQCSEICGSGHSFIPIYIEAVSYKNIL